VARKLPARPNLEHLRSQAKKHLAQLKERGTLPDGFRLADAQLHVARESGFASWPALARHVQDLRALEGEWHFTSLDVDGNRMPAAMLASSRILIDGDRFRTESPEANYDGVFTIDVEATPPHIDIEFIEGPEAGNWSHGIYELDGERLTLCLGVLAGVARPTAFAAKTGSGHALERLQRVSASRPANVTGGTKRAPAAPSAADGKPEKVDPALFDVPMTPMLQRLQGDWIAVELVTDGKPMPEQWLAYGSRTNVGNEVKVVFGGQTFLHAKQRIDERASPMAIDYLNLAGKKGTVSRGIMEWIGDEVRFSIAAPGASRPSDFAAPPAKGTFSRWRRK
jgi:uncharacterized protein (TIGR03067 family)